MKTHILPFVLISLLFNVNSLFADNIQKTSLNGTWQLFYWNQPYQPVTSPDMMSSVEKTEIKAQVPGNVELDLLAAGKISDPMIGNNVNELRSIEGYQWCYTKKFNWGTIEKGKTYQLFFGGIDCLADIWLNGKHIGKAENMLIEHTFDISQFLNENSENMLQVILRSSVLEGQNKLLGTFSVGNFPSEESIFLRKPPHMFGWDIMPRLVSAGLWKDVEIQVLNPEQIRNIQYMVPLLDINSKSARLYVDMQIKMPFERFDKVKAVYTISRNGQVVNKVSSIISSPAFRQSIEMKNVDFWWPRGYGEPALYDAKVEIVDSDNNVLAQDNRRIGIRTIKLDISDINLPPDNPGRFCFIVNNEPIFIKGTNWVPMDALHSRDNSFIDESIEMAVDLNCNMIRCWGGNVYEDTHFFDLCDENGIMVWQDFTMGCTFYPQRSSFAQALETEAISVVCKLRNHPSLVLWSGNNEDDAALRWSLQPLNINPNKDNVSRKVLPAVIYEFDPIRPYLPSSPYYSEETYHRGSGNHLLPENHLWGPRGYYKDGFYTNAECVFVSEIGYHGCPNLESLKRMMTKDCVYPWTKNFEWNDEWVTKSVRRFAVEGKTFNRNNLMLNQIRLLFGDVPTKLEDFIFASQSVQAEAMKYFIEMWRGQKFDKKTGIIWWNLRDGWPIISDAIVDYYMSKKMAYHFIKNVQRDVCVLINDAKDGNNPLIGVNDTRNNVSGEVSVVDLESGEKLFEGAFEIPANGKTTISQLKEKDSKGIYLIKYKVNGTQYINHYLYGKPPFDLKKYKKLINDAGILKAQK